eukprot:3475469-Ditylum_brightwellii.AAC.1
MVGEIYVVSELRVNKLGHKYICYSSHEKYLIHTVKQTKHDFLENPPEDVPKDSSYGLLDWDDLDFYEFGNIKVLVMELFNVQEKYCQGKNQEWSDF